MKQANKFMVVPFEEKKIEQVEIKTKDQKISDILNNKFLEKSDKNKLINQHRFHISKDKIKKDA